MSIDIGDVAFERHLLICEKANDDCYECDHIKFHCEIYGCNGANCTQKECRPICISLEEYNRRNEFLKEDDFEI